MSLVYDSLCTAPPLPDPPHLRKRSTVRHLHGDGVMREDTWISLFHLAPLPESNPQAWVIEKRLTDVSPYVHAELAVDAEVRAISRCMTLNLPCPPLVDPPMSLKRQSDSSHSLFSRYGGPSLEELFRYSLSPREYAGIMVAMCETLQRYADVGVFVTDTSPRNMLIPLSHVIRGELNFEGAVAIDHRHSIFAETAPDEPWPYLSVSPEAAPEIHALLLQDVQRPLAEQMADTYFGRKTHLRLEDVPIELRGFFLQRCTSPALGGALKSGMVNLDHAMQSISAHGWLVLLSEKVARSRQLHPDALSFLWENIVLLNRMNAPQASHRFACLTDAAAAWRELRDTFPQTRPSQIVLDLAIVGDVLEGSAPPQTLPVLVASGNMDPIDQNKIFDLFDDVPIVSHKANWISRITHIQLTQFIRTLSRLKPHSLIDVHLRLIWQSVSKVISVRYGVLGLGLMIASLTYKTTPETYLATTERTNLRSQLPDLMRCGSRLGENSLESHWENAFRILQAIQSPSNREYFLHSLQNFKSVHEKKLSLNINGNFGYNDSERELALNCLQAIEKAGFS